jgi:hypothetical protein
VIHVLIGYLRDRLQDVSRLNAQFAALQQDGVDRDYAVTA